MSGSHTSVSTSSNGLVPLIPSGYLIILLNVHDSHRLESKLQCFRSFPPSTKLFLYNSFTLLTPKCPNH